MKGNTVFSILVLFVGCSLLISFILYSLGVIK